VVDDKNLTYFIIRYRFPELGYEVFEEKFRKPLELYSHANSNVICMNSLNTVIANAIGRSKFGEAGFDKHDIFSSPAFVEKNFL
jgi:hypothetical protein